MPSLIFNEGQFSDIGVIVNTKIEADLVLCDILMGYDRDQFTPFSFIFYTEQIDSISRILSPEQEQVEIGKSIIDLTPYISPNVERDNIIYNQFIKILYDIENEYTNIEEGEYGGCWLWFFDSLHILTRALLNKDRIEVNIQGKYLCFPFEFNNSRGLNQREQMTKDLAKRLKEIFNVDCGYFSVLMSDDIDAIPFYCSQNYGDFENRLINSQSYNC